MVKASFSYEFPKAAGYIMTLCLERYLLEAFFFFNDTATTEIYTLSLHDALPIFGGILMGRYGWRSFFLVLGLLSLIWLLPWLQWMPRHRDEHATSGNLRDKQTPGILEILKLRSAWGTCAALACLDYLSYFFLTWKPTYLVRGRNFSIDQMAAVMGAAYVLCALIVALWGWLSDRWIVSGASPALVRKGFNSVGMAGAAIFMIPFRSSGPELT